VTDEPQINEERPAQLGYINAPDGVPLYVAYRAAPEGAFQAPERSQAIVIAPPLFEERKSSYAPLRRLARLLADAGHAVLRFDYRGSGESGGSAQRSGSVAGRRWQDLAEDLATAR
jgi:predicted alpha/beta hydrolase